MADPILTTVVGSYPQPEWLIDRRRLLERLAPRVRDLGLWLTEQPRLEQAQDEATVEAGREMERAGIDVLTDGEIRRESYSNRFATALTGLDRDHPGVFIDRNGMENYVPRAHYATGDKSSRGGYPFFRELGDIPVNQLVIEAAQPRHDLAMLKKSLTKTSPSACLTSATRASRLQTRSPSASERPSSMSIPSG